MAITGKKISELDEASVNALKEKVLEQSGKIIRIPASVIGWESDNYLGRTANLYFFEDESLTEEIIEHGTVLGYCKVLEMPDIWSPLPLIRESNDGLNRIYVQFDYSEGLITLIAYQTSGVYDPTGYVLEYRFMLIKDVTVVR